MVKWMTTMLALMMATLAGVSALPQAVADTTPGASSTTPGASLNTTDSSLNATDSSFNATDSSLNTTDSSLNTTDSSLNATDSSFNATDPSINATDSSFNATDSSLNTTDSSINATDSSFNATDSSLNATDSSLNATDSSFNTTDPKAGPGGLDSREIGENTTSTMKNVTVMSLTPECKARMKECSVLLTPGPLGPPNVVDACSASNDTNCSSKFTTCKIMEYRPVTNRSSSNWRLCLGVQAPGCEGRAQACRKLLHSSEAFHHHKLDCMTQLTGCPLDPRVDPEAREFMKQCVEPSLKADLEAINNTLVRDEVLSSFDSCFKDNEIPGAIKCLTKSCINVIVL